MWAHLQNLSSGQVRILRSSTEGQGHTGAIKACPFVTSFCKLKQVNHSCVHSDCGVGLINDSIEWRWRTSSCSDLKWRTWVQSMKACLRIAVVGGLPSIERQSCYYCLLGCHTWVKGLIFCWCAFCRPDFYLPHRLLRRISGVGSYVWHEEFTQVFRLSLPYFFQWIKKFEIWL